MVSMTATQAGARGRAGSPPSTVELGGGGAQTSLRRTSLPETTASMVFTLQPNLSVNTHPFSYGDRYDIKISCGCIMRTSLLTKTELASFGPEQSVR